MRKVVTSNQHPKLVASAAEGGTELFPITYLKGSLPGAEPPALQTDDDVLGFDKV